MGIWNSPTNSTAFVERIESVALRTVNSLPEAVRSFNQAIGIHRPLVEQEGRFELTESLARGIYNRALTLSDLPATYRQ